ncbi:MAG: 3'-5' exonuclease domain-containing protein 2 [Bacteroidales bacterium]|nr:3'-5' exonuclease domain-containing protein 2 [Bacteroidales bacterium]
MWQKEITNDEINELDLSRYEGEIVLIEDLDGFREAVKELSKESIIGIDTETRPSFKKGIKHPVALIQIASKKRVFLFRINKSGFCNELVSLFQNPKIVKVGIAVHNDLQELTEFHPFTPQGVVDLNEYCQEIGFVSIGVKKLTALVLGFRVSKRQRVSNWEAEVLSQAQVNYAATDAWVCREIYLALHSIKN